MLFTGRLTGDAAVKTVNGDKQLINFTVAINQRWKDKAGEKKEKAAFIDCTYWRHTGLAEYLSKGAVVEILGWVEAEAYQSTTRGLQSRLTCTCDTIKLFTMTAKSNDPANSTEKTAVTAGAKAAGDDDLPF
ncbi:single-stranded DNA-binding protein [Mucilaginibacter dorajii]|uniref:Single-stranded DNA-binding protein n=1 Tax=Mucilaginibacter dorajii TaxID=692994 RepID=A0ABP7QY97_9SPHI|nr:single-stranded DNA-binding protein [Mucilaginibacter dorajii]MCS3732339.1 single-strand DNA-binding protein [Mucilaginibacter dorajii]